jgi:hypothetical protein
VRRSNWHMCGPIAEALRARESEVVSEICAHQADCPTEEFMGDYANGLAGGRAVVAALVDYGLAALEDKGAPRAAPLAMIEEARSSARCGRSLDAVLRGHLAIHRAVTDVIVIEAGHASSRVLPLVVELQGSLLEDVIGAVTTEYQRERDRVARSPRQSLADRIEKLLAKKSVDVRGIDYDFDAWHLGVTTIGDPTEEALRSLARRFGLQFLSAGGNGDTHHGWLGSVRALSIKDIEAWLTDGLAADVRLVVGEPSRGLRGWRLTRWQASEALWAAARTGQRITRYADVSLLAAVLQSEMRTESLVDVFLSPISQTDHGGAPIEDTLRAYLAAGGSIKATAAHLNVDRRTVYNHRQLIEEQCGYQIHSHWAELVVALRVADLPWQDGHHSSQQGGAS